jgi:DNA repair protein RadC
MEEELGVVEAIRDTVLREVRVNYIPTITAKFLVRQPSSVAEFVRSILTDNSREHFVALYLDGNHAVVAYSIVAIGSANMVSVHPREIFQRALLVGTVSLLVSHNHPSDSLVPSTDDLQMTSKLNECAKLLGLKLLDHVIVVSEDFHSLRDSNPELFG